MWGWGEKEEEEEEKEKKKEGGKKGGIRKLLDLNEIEPLVSGNLEGIFTRALI